MAVKGRRLAKPALPEGPLKNLNDALHDLLRRAGRPSLRVLGTDVREGRLLPIPPSHTRIHDVFIRARLPDCDLMSCLVQVMAQRAYRLDPGLVPSAEGERFYRLWLAADEADRKETYTALKVPVRVDSDTAHATTGVDEALLAKTAVLAGTRDTGRPPRATSPKDSRTVHGQHRPGQHGRHSPLLPDPAQSRAVFIGTAKYTELSDLPGIEAGMHDLCEVLTHSLTGSFDRSTTSLMLNPSNATEALTPLEEAVTEARDTLFLHISCHGLISPYSGDLSLAMVGSRPDSSFTALPYDWIRELVASCPARRRVIMLDCCYSGRVLGAMGSDDFVVGTTQIEGTYLISATGSTRVAVAPPGEQYTSFTGELIRLLRDGIPDGPDGVAPVW
ncbi:caspase family protein [Streptosporangium sp. G11]|uniref:caspase family protein n=1 Tax=Streptosporangium sp. G11 TaxID=3436926 RepID=UPI003EC0F7E0